MMVHLCTIYNTLTIKYTFKVQCNTTLSTTELVYLFLSTLKLNLLIDCEVHLCTHVKYTLSTKSKSILVITVHLEGTYLGGFGVLIWVSDAMR